MEAYYWKRPKAQAQSTDTGTPTEDLEGSLSSEFNWYHQSPVDNEGWASELQWYLKDQPADVTKHTNTVTYMVASELAHYIN